MTGLRVVGQCRFIPVSRSSWGVDDGLALPFPILFAERSRNGGCGRMRVEAVPRIGELLAPGLHTGLRGSFSSHGALRLRKVQFKVGPAPLLASSTEQFSR